MIENAQISKLVKKIVGEFLFPLGFELKYKNLIWAFKKRITNSVGEDVMQGIFVLAYNYADDLSLELETDAYGRSPIHFYKTIDSKEVSRFRYSNEEDIINTLSIFVNFLKNEGLEKLRKISEPILSDHPNEHDEVLFLEQKEEWAKKFIEREKVKPYQSFTELAEWVCERIIERKYKPYGEVKQYLLELTAYFTLEFAKQYNIKWEFSSQFKSTLVVFPTGYEMFPIRDIFFAWLRDDAMTRRLIMKYVEIVPKV